MLPIYEHIFPQKTFPSLVRIEKQGLGKKACFLFFENIFNPRTETTLHIYTLVEVPFFLYSNYNRIEDDNKTDRDP